MKWKLKIKTKNKLMKLQISTDWTKLPLRNMEENYHLRKNGLAVKKPYKKEFALVWNDHYNLSKSMLNYRREEYSYEY